MVDRKFGLRKARLRFVTKLDYFLPAKILMPSTSWLMASFFKMKKLF